MENGMAMLAGNSPKIGRVIADELADEAMKHFRQHEAMLKAESWQDVARLMSDYFKHRADQLRDQSLKIRADLNPSPT